MKLNTVVIDIGGGDKVTVYKDVLRVTARLHEAKLKEYMRAIETVGSGNTGIIKMSELEKLDTMPKTDYMIDLNAIDNDAINEIYIVNQVVEWTLEGPVSHETIEKGMTREQYKVLVQEMDRLYKPVPLAGSAS